MLKFESKEEKRVINLISNYVTLSSLNRKIIGSMIFGYYDDSPVIEVLTYVDEEYRYSSYHITLSDITLIYRTLSKRYLTQSDDALNCDILYDPKNIILDYRKELEAKKNRVVATNQLDLTKYINIVRNNVYDNLCQDKSSLEFNVLVDYYYNLLIYSDSHKRFSYEGLKTSIETEKGMYYMPITITNKELHQKALLEAQRLRDEHKKTNMNKGKKYQLLRFDSKS